MSSWNESEYRQFFKQVNQGLDPYNYQVDVARRLIEGRSLVLRAPTGSGKTATVLTPFLYSGWKPRPARLIYALPLRTLAQSIYKAAREIASRQGIDPEYFVTIQTGEEPSDPFFQRGRIIVATYDQVLSGLLCGPYGLPGKLHNVNAAAIAGALVVFDEFHLMEPQRAFLTGTAGLYLFRELVQSIWMTATATPALVNELAEALGAEPAGPSPEEEAELPSVKTVQRAVVWEPAPLEATAVPRVVGRTIVLANTVARAQALYRGLAAANPDVPAMLLHSRFFKGHRRQKEERLHELFGKDTKGPALLVSTQVVEAGVDISCDHLHTELAPMNALVQRAGRCARFKGETGTVHVYPMRDELRAWLPYGSLREPDPCLLPTQRLLEEAGRTGASLTPSVAAEWVAGVHGAEDQRALAGGWLGQFGRVRAQIHRTAIARHPGGVGELIREPDTDDLRVIISRAENLPAKPGQREAITLNRWRLAGLIKDLGTEARPVGWYWEVGEEPAWQPLRDPSQLTATYVVAIDVSFARYTEAVGLEDGLPGDAESPQQEEPERPGHPPLHGEPWKVHVTAVAKQALRRLEEDGGDGWLGQRLERRYGLDARAIVEAVRACGLTHDLGKLQRGWQEWAAESQAARHPGYRHEVALAHTDFDASDPLDREREKRVAARRPEHSAAGAYLAAGLLVGLLTTAPAEQRVRLASACAAAVLAHHGGWLQSEGATRQDLGLQPLWHDAGKPIDEVFGPGMARQIGRLMQLNERREMLKRLLDQTTGDETLVEWWPLVAYLTRALRLADQRATAEGGKDE